MMGIRFLAITQPFLANWAVFFMGTQESIVYQLVMSNHDFYAFFNSFF